MAELEKIIGLLGIEAMLTPDQIVNVSTFLTSCRRMKDYLKRAESTGVGVAYYGGSMIDLVEIEDEINRCIRGERIDDRASQRLYGLRRSINSKEEQIKQKLEATLRKNKESFSESFVAIRNGRYTLPVKKECKSKVEGLLIDLSNSGGTCFIEPVAVRRMQDELSELKIEEDNEVRRILYTLTALVFDNLPSIKLNIEAMETLDFLFAKAKLSIDMKASPIRLTDSKDVRLLSARHPLLSQEDVVPLDFMLGDNIAGIVITGPNTGGKTVALKTVGLLALMTQSGLHVPADERSSICVFDKVFCDIGDGQSISDNLSTFSSHITNIIEILREASDNSLVLLDELGSGTDPAEGMGIAMAILEDMLSKRCLFAATTHYPEIKDFAVITPGLINARMAFDKESLMPLYKLEIGEAGESCALYIAERLGMPVHLLERARTITYSGPKHQKDRIAVHESDTIIQVIPLEITEKASEPTIVPRSQRFSIGDSVTVYPQREIGIVFARADEKGNIGVQIKGRKLLINHKRLKLKVSAGELYPEDYDFSIVFDSVEDRKARRVMDRRHMEGNTIIIKDGRNGK
jgi:dsDNA-specific endonuclease/ATPase MutS2